MLKAIGVTAAVGTVGTGVVGAQEGPGGNCVLGTPGEGCNAYTQDGGNEIAVGQLPTTVDGVNIALTNEGTAVVLTYDSSQVTVQALGVKGSNDCAVYDEPTSGTVYNAPINQGGQQSEVSNVAIIICPANGDDAQVHFYGCSQVCSDTKGTTVEYVDANGDTQTGSTDSQSNRNDPPVRGWDAVYCFAPPDGSAIVSAGGQDNPNRCAQNYR